MIKKLIRLIFVVFLAINLCGCAAVMISAVENLEAKEDLDVSYSQAVDIVKGSVIEQGIKFQKAVIDENVAKVSGIYNGDQSVHVFILKISDAKCSLAVRVGTSEEEKKIAKEILQNIIDYSKK